MQTKSTEEIRGYNLRVLLQRREAREILLRSQTGHAELIWLKQKIREHKAGKGSWGHGAENPEVTEKRRQTVHKCWKSTYNIKNTRVIEL